ncbi:putative uncharacterized protein, putative [Babesia ovata]|uniref:Uncharacterized protein n=1 Tax=Babesia ovata TaxID=189622 RepID=A0A2H6KE73_9APIC|nr:putative uncharacterized protein, putative [Babesia ovata]GBE61293.1 putative uncharacterized protein, putative [Babesia ovata]
MVVFPLHVAVNFEDLLLEYPPVMPVEIIARVTNLVAQGPELLLGHVDFGFFLPELCEAALQTLEELASIRVPDVLLILFENLLDAIRLILSSFGALGALCLVGHGGRGSTSRPRRHVN